MQSASLAPRQVLPLECSRQLTFFTGFPFCSQERSRENAMQRGRTSVSCRQAYAFIPLWMTRGLLAQPKVIAEEAERLIAYSESLVRLLFDILQTPVRRDRVKGFSTQGDCFLGSFMLCPLTSWASNGCSRAVATACKTNILTVVFRLVGMRCNSFSRKFGACPAAQQGPYKPMRNAIRLEEEETLAMRKLLVSNKHLIALFEGKR